MRIASIAAGMFLLVASALDSSTALADGYIAVDVGHADLSDLTPAFGGDMIGGGLSYGIRGGFEFEAWTLELGYASLGDVTERQGIACPGGCPGPGYAETEWGELRALTMKGSRVFEQDGSGEWRGGIGVAWLDGEVVDAGSESNSVTFGVARNWRTSERTFIELGVEIWTDVGLRFVASFGFGG